jgi:hypothetical protein
MPYPPAPTLPSLLRSEICNLRVLLPVSAGAQMGPRARLEPVELGLLLKAVDDVTNPLVAVCTRLWEPADAMPQEASFTVGATLAALLQDNLLPVPAQRLVAIYILYDLITSRCALTRHPHRP